MAGGWDRLRAGFARGLGLSAKPDEPWPPTFDRFGDQLDMLVPAAERDAMRSAMLGLASVGARPDQIAEFAMSYARGQALEQHPAPTHRQRAALGQMVARARDEHGVHAPHWDEHGLWLTHWHPETRPGRGRALNTVYHDGEMVIQILLDPYGSGSLAVGEVEWTHSDSNDDCDCSACEIDD